jgi:hypothetical protein
MISLFFWLVLLMRSVDGNLYTGDATSLQAQNRKFWAQLTSYDGAKWYAWTEVQPTYGGTFVKLDGARFGTITPTLVYPAYCADQNLAVPISTSVIGSVNGSYVEMERAYFDAGSTTLQWVWVFNWAPSGNTFVTQTITNAVTITDNNTFNWIINDPITFTGPGPFIFNTFVTFQNYFIWDPINITDPTNNIVLNPGNDPKLRFITGPFVVVTENQIGDNVALPEIQKVWVVNATGGTFGLILTSADGTQFATASGIAWNAAAATVQTALNTAAATFTVPYTVTVTGNGTAAVPWVVTFSGFAPYAVMLQRYDTLTGASLSITYNGISGGVDGRILVIENAGPGKIILLDDGSAGAATAYAASQGIDCPLGFDYTIWPDNAVLLEYDVYGDGKQGLWRFMHPTYSTSGPSDSDLVYANQRTYYGSGLTHTPDGKGGATVTVDPPVPTGGMKDTWYWYPGKTGTTASGGSKAWTSYEVAGPHNPSGLTQSITFSGNEIIYLPLVRPRGGTIDEIGVHLDVGFTGGKIRLGIYNNISDTNCYPGSLLQDFGEKSLTGTNVSLRWSITQALSPGLYWIAFWCDNSYSGRSINESVGYVPSWPGLGYGDMDYIRPSIGWRIVQTYVAGSPPKFPDPASNALTRLGSRSDELGADFHFSNLPAVFIHYSA